MTKREKMLKLHGKIYFLTRIPDYI